MEIINIGVSSKGNFIMVGLAGTQIIIYDLKGEFQSLYYNYKITGVIVLAVLTVCGNIIQKGDEWTPKSTSLRSTRNVLVGLVQLLL